MEGEKVSERTIKDYTSTLDRLRPISSPPDIGRYEEKYGIPLSSKVEKAVGKLLRYVKVRQASTTFLGYDHELWRVQFNALKAAAEESTDTSRVKDLTSDEILAGYHRLDENLKPFYAFLAYTGMRAEQAYDILSSWKDEKVEQFSQKVEGKTVEFCRYATSDVSRGKKMSYYAFFPASLHREIRTYQLPYLLSTITTKIRETATTDPARPINVSNLRKYAVNMLRRGKAVDWDVAEYIQGRRPKGVGQARYISLKDLAVEQYPIALIKNMPVLFKPGPTTAKPQPQQARPPENAEEKPPSPDREQEQRRIGDYATPAGGLRFLFSFFFGFLLRRTHRGSRRILRISRRILFFSPSPSIHSIRCRIIHIVIRRSCTNRNPSRNPIKRVLIIIIFHLALHFNLVFPTKRAFALLSSSGRPHFPFVPARKADGYSISGHHREKWRSEEKKRVCQRRS